jgi:hypothetical protein
LAGPYFTLLAYRCHFVFPACRFQIHAWPPVQALCLLKVGSQRAKESLAILLNVTWCLVTDLMMTRAFFIGGNMLRDFARFPEPPTEVALPCLLRVKCGLQGFHLLYQFLDPSSMA